MSKFVRIGDELIDLSAVTYAAVTYGKGDQVSEIRLLTGNHTINLHSYGNHARLSAAWKKILDALEPELIEVPPQPVASAPSIPMSSAPLIAARH